MCKGSAEGGRSQARRSAHAGESHSNASDSCSRGSICSAIPGMWTMRSAIQARAVALQGQPIASYKCSLAGEPCLVFMARILGSRDPRESSRRSRSSSTRHRVCAATTGTARSAMRSRKSGSCSRFLGHAIATRRTCASPPSRVSAKNASSRSPSGNVTSVDARHWPNSE